MPSRARLALAFPCAAASWSSRRDTSTFRGPPAPVERIRPRQPWASAPCPCDAARPSSRRASC
eukprot:2627922-Prymnesium_polylepis.1